MRPSRHTSLFAICCLVAVGYTAVPALARQSEPPAGFRRVDLSADLIASELVDGVRVNRLEGNVVLVEDSTVLRADRATEYVSRDLIVFTGNVSIVEDTDTLTADVIRYERSVKVGEASGRVVLSDGDVRVFGPVARYNADERYAWFEDGVTLVDSSATLESKLGEYWSREKRALFRENVRLVNGTTITTADSVTYFRETEIADAAGLVRVVRIDTTERRTTTMLFSETLRTDRSGSRSSAAGRALMLRVSPDSSDGSASSDTLSIRAGRLVATESDSMDSIVAVGDVEIWRDSIAALADSAYMERDPSPDAQSTEWVRLFRDPVLWYRDTQLTGDSIRVLLRDGEVDSLFVDGRAFLAQEDTTLGRIQQVRGSRIRGRFAGGDGNMIVGPDAQAIYFLDEAGERNGAMRMAASTITFSFRNDSLRTIRAAEDIDGTYYDEEIVPAGFQLDNLDWQADRKPARTIFATDPRFITRDR